MSAPALANPEQTGQASTGGGTGAVPAPAPEQKVEGQATPQPPKSGDAGKPAPAEGDGGKAEPTGENPAQPPKPRAPERYEFKKVEGLSDDHAFDKDTHEAWSKAARELDLDQDQAQKVLQTLAPQFARQLQSRQEALHKGWLEAQKGDKEIGGEKLKASIDAAQKVLADPRIATPELRALLDGPLGDHPELVRLFARIQRFMRDDSPADPSAAGQGDEEQAKLEKRYAKTLAQQQKT